VEEWGAKWWGMEVVEGSVEGIEVGKKGLENKFLEHASDR
jgi:hypothetical protein